MEEDLNFSIFLYRVCIEGTFKSKLNGLCLKSNMLGEISTFCGLLKNIQVQ